MHHFTGNLFAYFQPGFMSSINADAIAHVCNCQGVMGSGIALSIKEQYPEAYVAYKRHEYVHGKIELGTVSSAVIVPGKHVYNIHAQEFYGKEKRHLDYEALYTGLTEVRTSMLKAGLRILGVPFNMGCDRAGGHWKIVEAMLDVIFDDDKIVVFSVALP